MNFLAGEGFFLSVQDPRNGMPKLWLDLLAPQSEGPPMWTFSSFQISPRGSGPDLMPFLFSFFSILLGSVDIFLEVLVV